MNNRENYLAMLNHEQVEWIPSMFTDVVMCGGQGETFENGPAGGGFDWFGNNWIPTASAGGQPALDPKIILLDDVCDWEDKVAFPDLDKFDWQGFADLQLADVDRENKVIEYHTWNSVFLRFTHLMGFEEALISMYEEPEASSALMNAIADYKIRVIEHAHKYYKPDVFVHYDDVATEKSPFMSPEVFRELIAPAHKKICDAAKSYDILPVLHCCGNCQVLIPDFIKSGHVAWQAAQPVNDICKVIEDYGDKISVIGGYDTQGPAAAPDVADDVIAAEVTRCMKEYGKYGHSYAYFGFFLGGMDNPEIAARYGTMIGTYMSLAHQ